jgi:hypothetical protein
MTLGHQFNGQIIDVRVLTMIPTQKTSVKKRRQGTAPVLDPRRVSQRVKSEKWRSISVPWLQKLHDGREVQREEESMWSHTKYPGERPYMGAGEVTNSLRNQINHRKRVSQAGGNPCYDVLDDHGSSIYVYSLPLNLMRGLLQGFKTEESVKAFNSNSRTLGSHRGTKYEFYHWNFGNESVQGDYHIHPFMRQRPDLTTTIESLGSLMTKKVLLNEDLTNYQPGTLANVRHDQKAQYQAPHFDFEGWMDVAAADLPWVLHIPMCREGMMVSVWPTQRLEVLKKGQTAKENETSESITLGSPKLVHIGFGDALLLRADVAHGGCFGSVGNIRFHMVLRKPICNLDSTQLCFLAKQATRKDYEETTRKFEKLLGDDQTCVFHRLALQKKISVDRYIFKLNAMYPALETSWLVGLLDLIRFEASLA